jgi:hypothetical protein
LHRLPDWIESCANRAGWRKRSRQENRGDSCSRRRRAQRCRPYHPSSERSRS